MAERKLTHETIANTAKNMAGEWYEVAAHDDTFYSHYPSQTMFISKEWSRFIPLAKSVLTDMLSMVSVSEAQKEEIADALCKDHDLALMEKWLK